MASLNSLVDQAKAEIEKLGLEPVQDRYYVERVHAMDSDHTVFTHNVMTGVREVYIGSSIVRVEEHNGDIHIDAINNSMDYIDISETTATLALTLSGMNKGQELHRQGWTERGNQHSNLGYWSTTS